MEVMRVGVGCRQQRGVGYVIRRWALGCSPLGGHGYYARGGLALRLRSVDGGSERDASPQCPRSALGCVAWAVANSGAMTLQYGDGLWAVVRGGHGCNAHGGLTPRLRSVDRGSDRDASPQCPRWALVAPRLRSVDGGSERDASPQCPRWAMGFGLWLPGVPGLETATSV